MISSEWSPSRFVRQLRSIATSTGPAEIVTDQGRCYLKALGNKEGPHVLAADWVGTALADWLGLRTFAVAKLDVWTDDEIVLGHDRSAQPGPAIAFKAQAGGPWGGSLEELRALANPADLSRLVVLDTWLLNCDRHPPDLSTRKPNYDNVFLSADGAPEGKFAVMAIDHTHCFTCGRELNAKLANIDRVKDSRTYGRFPEFEEFLDRATVEESASRLAAVNRNMVEEIVAQVPVEWSVSEPVRSALTDLIVERADYVSTTIVGSLFPE